MLSLMMIGVNAQPLQLNDIDWPPYFFPDRSQYKPGLGKTLLTSCIKQLGYDFNYNHLPIKRTHYYMQTGELDITVYSYQTAREDAVVYGKEPMFINAYGFAVKSDSRIQINKVDDISTLTFGHLAGLTHTEELHPVLQKMTAQSKVVETYELNATLRQLVTTPPRIDITANSKATLLWRIKELGLSNQISVLDFELAAKPYYVAVSKNSKTIQNATEFVQQFDRCLQDMKQNGQYHDIAETYGL
jgi:ABC-type amino acid transport substrate-binding protein